MNIFDKESRIIETLQGINISRLTFLNCSFPLLNFCFSLYVKHMFSSWIDNSSNTNCPPDFYSDRNRSMLEVMRVDDYKNGPNHPNAYESRKYRELADNLSSEGIVFDTENDLCIVNTLPDVLAENNVDLYLQNFSRVVKKHSEKTSQYRKAHPGYKLGFLIFDESPAYAETKNRIDKMPSAGDRIEKARYYYAPYDKRFIDVLLETDVDYIIWMTPYKWINGNPAPKEVFLLDVKKARKTPIKKLIDYKMESIICLEAY